MNISRSQWWIHYILIFLIISFRNSRAINMTVVYIFAIISKYFVFWFLRVERISSFHFLFCSDIIEYLVMSCSTLNSLLWLCSRDIIYVKEISLGELSLFFWTSTLYITDLQMVTNKSRYWWCLMLVCWQHITRCQRIARYSFCFEFYTVWCRTLYIFLLQCVWWLI